MPLAPLPARITRLAAAATLLLLTSACTTTGGGGTVVNVQAGRTTPIAFFSTFNPRTCQNGPRPTTRIVQPANGTVEARPSTDSFSVAEFGAGDRKCAGQSMRGVRIVYTPDPGYRGPDSFTVRHSFAQRIGVRSTSNASYRVNVQ